MNVVAIPASFKTAPPDPKTLALRALAFLAADADRLSHFACHTGLCKPALRSVAEDPHKLATVLDYMLGREQLLLAFAAEIGVAPAIITLQRHRYRMPR